MALEGVPSILGKKPATDSADQVAKYISMLEAMLAEAKAECEHECEERAKERDARLQAEMAATTARAEATAERARADAAERARDAEARRADECDRMHKACMDDCEQLRTKLIGEVDARAKAEGALQSRQTATVPAATPPAPPGWVMRASKFDDLGNILEMTLTPKEA